MPQESSQHGETVGEAICEHHNCRYNLGSITTFSRGTANINKTKYDIENSILKITDDHITDLFNPENIWIKNVHMEYF